MVIKMDKKLDYVDIFVYNGVNFFFFIYLFIFGGKGGARKNLNFSFLIKTLTLMDIIARCTHKEKKMKQYIFKVSFQISPRISLSFIYSFIYLIYLFIHLFILLFLKNKKNIFTSHI